MPWREIAIGTDEKPVFADPSKENYGFWPDQDMRYEEFEGESADKSEFKSYRVPAKHITGSKRQFAFVQYRLPMAGTSAVHSLFVF